MLRTLYRISVLCLLLPAGTTVAMGSTVLVLNDPAYPIFHASALDQPVLDVYLTDPQNNDEIFWDYDPNWEEDVPVIFKAFVDTGASGFVISHLTATGLYDVPALRLTESDYIGSYTELGIGGPEAGNVSRPLGVHVLNGTRQTGWEGNLDEFTAYGDFNLWVRQQEGIGEKIEFMGFVWPNPINIVGMPVIRQGIMIMDPTPMSGDWPEYLETYLLPPGSPEPEHNLTLRLVLQDFIGETPPPGEVFPSHSVNPMVPSVTVTHSGPDAEAASVTGSWLYDTGAGSSFVSFAHAQAIGLVPSHYADLESFTEDHVDAGGNFAVVGGIGHNMVTVPILNVDEIRIPTKEGFDIAWRNVNVLIKEISELSELGIDGIFGMNLLVPSVTLDGHDPGNLEPLMNPSPGVFRSITFDATDEENAELRLFTFRLTTSFESWRQAHFQPHELNDASISGPRADPDHDGVANLVEYGLGRHPQTASRAGLPEPAVQKIEEQHYLTLTYERIKPAPDVAFFVEGSSDLVTWTTDGTDIVEVVDLGNRERITVRDSEPLEASGRRFLRLRVELLED